MKKGCIIYCIEKGLLEKNTLLSIATLKEYGGQFADFDIFCIQPRNEFPISNHTKKALKKLNAQFIAPGINNHFRYFKFANKPFACEYVFENFEYDNYIFFDSDTLILNEPVQLTNSGKDISLHKVFRKGIGIENKNDKNFFYWKRILEMAGCSYTDDLPKITTFLDKKRVLQYWNAGILSVTKNTTIIQEWSRLLKKILQSGVQPSDFGIFFTEQSALSATILANQIQVHDLPVFYNFPLTKDIDQHPKLFQSFLEFDNIIILHHFNNLMFLKAFSDKKYLKVMFAEEKMKEFGIIHESRLFQFQRKYYNLLQTIKERYYYSMDKRNKQHL